MNDIFIGSDHHIGHRNILNFCPSSRPFETVEEMDNAIIERHNSLVKPEDEMYFLGDFSFSSVDRTCEVLAQMNGNKTYLFGNHCRVMKDHKISKYFKQMQKYMEIKVDNKDIILFHFPILEWNKCHRGSYHFFGHLHSNLVRGRSMDIGLDSNNCYPHNVRELLIKLEKHEKNTN